MQEKIVYFLKKRQQYISGEELSQHLNISRQALWKHIQELREAGYDILAIPHLGYCLVSSPDRLLPSEVRYELHTKFIGSKLYYFEEIASTMDMATQAAIDGAIEGTVVLAETQTKGRGRLGRGWSSPKYKGIYLSLILRPKILPNQAPVLTLLAAVSVCEAISETVGLDIQIKWPNDIIIQNKKLGGVLTELNAEIDIIRFMIIGIGLNVNNDKKSLLHTATSLKECKKENIRRVGLLQEILRKIEDNYLNFQKEKTSTAIIDKWRDYNVTLGRKVKLIYQKRQLTGEAVDIDLDGGLLIRMDSGLIEKVMAGDIVHCS